MSEPEKRALPGLGLKSSRVTWEGDANRYSASLGASLVQPIDPPAKTLPTSWNGGAR